MKKASRKQSIDRRDGTVLVYTAELLPYSETFVRDHVASLKQRDALLVGGKRIAGLSTEGLSTAILPSSRSSRLSLWMGGISPALDRLVDKHDVRLIHAHFADAGARLARYARRRGLPLVVTLHGSDVLSRSRGPTNTIVNRILWPELMRSANLFLPVSDHLNRAAVGRGFPRAKLRRHYLGIPIFPRMKRRAKSDAPPIIVFVGRIVEKKGLPFLLGAARILADRGHDFRLNVIGDGPSLNRHRAEVASLSDKVSFLGRLPPERVREELAAANIFCMPSIEAMDGDNEGLPIVSLEAQAAELPVVAFDQGPVPEGVEANVTGLLAEDRSTEDLAACLERLLLDPQLRLHLGKQGRQNVETNFDIELQARALEDIYEEVLAKHAGGTPGIVRDFVKT